MAARPESGRMEYSAANSADKHISYTHTSWHLIRCAPVLALNTKLKIFTSYLSVCTQPDLRSLAVIEISKELRWSRCGTSLLLITIEG